MSDGNNIDDDVKNQVHRDNNNNSEDDLKASETDANNENSMPSSQQEVIVFAPSLFFSRMIFFFSLRMLIFGAGCSLCCWIEKISTFKLSLIKEYTVVCVLVLITPSGLIYNIYKKKFTV